MIDTLRMYARFAYGLRDFYKNQTSLEQATRLVRQCIREREQNFLRVVRTAVFGWSKSPYLWLFRQAACQFGDVEKLVLDDGLDNALIQLRAAGVYVTFEEFKGRKPIRRGQEELQVGPKDFFNPYLTNVYYSETGGNTGAGARIPHDLDHLRLQAAQQAITQHAHGVLGLPTAIWCGILPDGSGINYILRSGHIGFIPARWFSQTSVWRLKPSTLKFQIATLVPVIAARLAGLKMPFPEALPLSGAGQIARWAESAIREHGGCLVNSSVSRAVRVCAAAKESGIDLQGATFRVSGEPVSPSKVQRITDSGARFYTSYVQSEAGRIAEGCCAPSDPTDVHLLTGFCALISYPRQVSGVADRVDAFHLTTIMPQAPIIMLNTELDDCGTIEQRSCGCPLEDLGMNIHLTGIYSYDKLTSEGVALLGSDMVRIIEVVLPKHLGGTPQDYQFVEAENAEGLTRLSLLVSPRIKVENDQTIKDLVLSSIHSTGPAGADARQLWQQADTLQIERREPIWTDRGKLLTLFRSRSPRLPAGPHGKN